MKQWMKQWRSLVGLILVLCFFIIIGPSSFYSLLNMKTILSQTVIIGFGALGMAILIIAGQLDLSAGSQMSLVTVVMALFLSQYTDLSNSSSALFFAVFLGLITAIAASSVVGTLVSYLALPPFLASLGLMQVYRGLAKGLAKETTVMTPENSLTQWMVVEPTPSWLILAPGVWLFFLATILLIFLFRKTLLGRWVYAIGSSESASILSGLPVKRLKLFFYILSGVFIGCAGVFEYSTLTVGDPTAGYGFELDVIAAVILGGASLNGGRGSIAGTFLGSLMIAVLRNGCNMLGVSSFLQEILVGSIILAVVAVDQFSKSKTSNG